MSNGNGSTGGLSDTVLSAARIAAQAWAAAMQVRRGTKKCPPWDEAIRFQNPTFNSFGFNNGAPASNIAPANPQRVGLIISNDSTLYPAFVGPSPGVTATGQAGIKLSTTTGPLTLIQAEWGPLVAIDWFGVANPNSPDLVQITVIELLLRDWPNQ